MEELYREKRTGTYGIFEIEISVSAPDSIDLSDSNILDAAAEAADKVRETIMKKVVGESKEDKAATALQFDQLTSLFPQPIYVETIPNGYCSLFCCAHLPWFIVTTKVGRIKVGWRKHVINIDWEDTPKTMTAEELFPKENVTKGHKTIHAWDIHSARKYVAAIINSIPI